MILQQAMGLGLIEFHGRQDCRDPMGAILPEICPPRTGRDAVPGFIVVMLICALASTLAIRVALRVDPATAIGG